MIPRDDESELPPSSRRVRRGGIGMIIAGWAVAIIAATLFFGNVLERRANPNRADILNSQSDELILQQNANGHYFAEGTINGHPAVFLLDTGATQIAVSQRLADELNLTVSGQAAVSTANGVVVAGRTRIDSLRIGPIEFRDVAAVVAPNLPDEILLGMNALKQLDFTQQHGELILRRRY